MTVENIQALIDTSMATKQVLREDRATLEQVARLADMCLASLRKGGKVIFAGNGGSFADAQHLSAEFVSRFMFDRAPLASIALGTNSSAMSAIGNDYGYEQVFSRELAAVAKPEDVFIAISTSGNSPNVLAAVEVAREIGVATVGLTGQSGGKMKSLCDCICAPSNETARIQECHIMLGHILCGLVEEGYFPEERKQ
ncbi:MAG: D-sedoheptulose 7-phosphate isomerase [Oxalicibacterium faecigallinarum]|nr:D-sedoheptulose 7-phosphate isomerase [Oxalicibacterium faecigallinarum]MDQ7969611.1 D-sedoheptulose 7-phosphate isomerase [Oxalicibacterium faecigallinarum]